MSINEDIEKKLEDLENRVAALERILVSPSSEENKKKQRPPAIREFLNEKNPKTNLDRSLAIAVYHNRFIDPSRDSFNVKDIEDLIPKAKLKKPANINDVINKNVIKGYFEEDGKEETGKKKWYVTGSGISRVDSNFENQRS